MEDLEENSVLKVVPDHDLSDVIIRVIRDNRGMKGCTLLEIQKLVHTKFTIEIADDLDLSRQLLKSCKKSVRNGRLFKHGCKYRVSLSEFSQDPQANNVSQMSDKAVEKPPAPTPPSPFVCELCKENGEGNRAASRLPNIDEECCQSESVHLRGSQKCCLCHSLSSGSSGNDNSNANSSFLEHALIIDGGLKATNSTASYSGSPSSVKESFVKNFTSSPPSASGDLSCTVMDDPPHCGSSTQQTTASDSGFKVNAPDLPQTKTNTDVNKMSTKSLSTKEKDLAGNKVRKTRNRRTQVKFLTDGLTQFYSSEGKRKRPSLVTNCSYTTPPKPKRPCLSADLERSKDEGLGQSNRPPRSFGKQCTSGSLEKETGVRTKKKCHVFSGNNGTYQLVCGVTEHILFPHITEEDVKMFEMARSVARHRQQEANVSNSQSCPSEMNLSSACSGIREPSILLPPESELNCADLGSDEDISIKSVVKETDIEQSSLQKFPNISLAEDISLTKRPLTVASDILRCSQANDIIDDKSSNSDEDNELDQGYGIADDDDDEDNDFALDNTCSDVGDDTKNKRIFTDCGKSPCNDSSRSEVPDDRNVVKDSVTAVVLNMYSTSGIDNKDAGATNGICIDGVSGRQSTGVTSDHKGISCADGGTEENEGINVSFSNPSDIRNIRFSCINTSDADTFGVEGGPIADVGMLNFENIGTASTDVVSDAENRKLMLLSTSTADLELKEHATDKNMADIVRGCVNTGVTISDAECCKTWVTDTSDAECRGATDKNTSDFDGVCTKDANSGDFQNADTTDVRAGGTDTRGLNIPNLVHDDTTSIALSEHKDSHEIGDHSSANHVNETATNSDARKGYTGIVAGSDVKDHVDVIGDTTDPPHCAPDVGKSTLDLGMNSDSFLDDGMDIDVSDDAGNQVKPVEFTALDLLAASNAANERESPGKEKTLINKALVIPGSELLDRAVMFHDTLNGEGDLSKELCSGDSSVEATMDVSNGEGLSRNLSSGDSSLEATMDHSHSAELHTQASALFSRMSESSNVPLQMSGEDSLKNETRESCVDSEYSVSNGVSCEENVKEAASVQNFVTESESNVRTVPPSSDDVLADSANISPKSTQMENDESVSAVMDNMLLNHNPVQGNEVGYASFDVVKMDQSTAELADDTTLPFKRNRKRKRIFCPDGCCSSDSDSHCVSSKYDDSSVKVKPGRDVKPKLETPKTSRPRGRRRKNQESSPDGSSPPEASASTVTFSAESSSISGLAPAAGASACSDEPATPDISADFSVLSTLELSTFAPQSLPVDSKTEIAVEPLAASETSILSEVPAPTKDHQPIEALSSSEVLPPEESHPNDVFPETPISQSVKDVGCAGHDVVLTNSLLDHWNGLDDFVSQRAGFDTKSECLNLNDVSGIVKENIKGCMLLNTATSDSHSFQNDVEGNSSTSADVSNSWVATHELSSTACSATGSDVVSMLEDVLSNHASDLKDEVIQTSSEQGTSMLTHINKVDVPRCDVMSSVCSGVSEVSAQGRPEPQIVAEGVHFCSGLQGAMEHQVASNSEQELFTTVPTGVASRMFGKGELISMIGHDNMNSSTSEKSVLTCSTSTHDCHIPVVNNVTDFTQQTIETRENHGRENIASDVCKFQTSTSMLHECYVPLNNLTTNCHIQIPVEYQMENESQIQLTVLPPNNHVHMISDSSDTLMRLVNPSLRDHQLQLNSLTPELYATATCHPGPTVPCMNNVSSTQEGNFAKNCAVVHNPRPPNVATFLNTVGGIAAPPVQTTVNTTSGVGTNIQDGSWPVQTSNFLFALPLQNAATANNIGRLYSAEAPVLNFPSNIMYALPLQAMVAATNFDRMDASETSNNPCNKPDSPQNSGLSGTCPIHAHGSQGLLPQILGCQPYIIICPGTLPISSILQPLSESLGHLIPHLCSPTDPRHLTCHSSMLGNFVSPVPQYQWGTASSQNVTAAAGSIGQQQPKPPVDINSSAELFIPLAGHQQHGEGECGILPTATLNFCSNMQQGNPTPNSVNVPQLVAENFLAQQFVTTQNLSMQLGVNGSQVADTNTVAVQVHEPNFLYSNSK